MRHENLLLRVGRYCRANKLTEREFSRVMGYDGRMIERMRSDGSRVQESTWDKVERFLESHGG